MSRPSMSVTPFGAVHFLPGTLDFPAQSCAIFNNSGTAAFRRASVTHRAALTALASASSLRPIQQRWPDPARRRADCQLLWRAQLRFLGRTGVLGSAVLDRTDLMTIHVMRAVTAISRTDWAIAAKLPAQEHDTMSQKKPRGRASDDDTIRQSKRLPTRHPSPSASAPMLQRAASSRHGHREWSRQPRGPHKLRAPLVIGRVQRASDRRGT